MNEIVLCWGAALWLGILTSISPCPLTTNIAAISYVSRRSGNIQSVLISGLLYTIGRSIAYIGVAVLVTRGLFSIPIVSIFLQKYMNLFIGPVMLIFGVLLLDIITFSFGGKSMSGLQSKVETMGIWGAGLLGIIFALSFCPTSAGLFFGGLIPLTIKTHNSIIVTILYGIGTAIPVIVFSLLLTFSTQLTGIIFKKLSIFEIWVRRGTATVMIIAGIIMILKHNLGLYFGI